MDTFKKILLVYFVGTSILLHLLLIAGILLMIPAIKMGMEMGRNFARQGGGDPAHVGVVEDVSVLKQGDHEYVGYAIDYQGQTLYVHGNTFNTVDVGDEVGLIIAPTPEPNMPFIRDMPMPKRLMVMVREKRQPRGEAVDVEHEAVDESAMDDEEFDDEPVEAVRPEVTVPNDEDAEAESSADGEVVAE